MKNFLISSIKKYYTSNKNVINIGAGGPIKDILLSQNIKFKEVDINEDKKPDYVLDIQNLSQKIPENSVDIYICIAVLEHVKNPFKAVDEMYKTLKTGGVIIGFVPFIFPIHVEPYDYFRFTKYGVKSIFSNFKIIYLKEINTYFISIYVLFTRLYVFGSLKIKIFLVFLFPLFLFLSLFFHLLSFFYKNKKLTSGYYFIVKK